MRRRNGRDAWKAQWQRSLLDRGGHDPARDIHTRGDGPGQFVNWGGRGHPAIRERPAPDLAEALKDEEERILNSLHNLNANCNEVGRRLRSAGEFLSRGQFRSWVTSAFGLSPGTARKIMRASEGDRSSRLDRCQRRSTQHMNDVFGAARGRRPTPNKAASPATKAGEPALHDRSTPEKEERRQDGTPATLEDNIDNTIESQQDTASWSRARGYAVRGLLRNYRVFAAMAAVVATELGMGGVL
jgi:hypothetical protein